MSTRGARWHGGGVSAATVLPRPPSVGRRVLDPLVAPGTWSGLLYLLVGAPIGLGWLALAAVGFSAGGATAVLGVGLVVLLATLSLSRGLAEADRRTANALLDAGIAAPAPRSPAPDRVVRARRLVADPRTWRSLAWLLFRAVAGAVVLVGALATALVLLALLVLPFEDGYLQWGDHWRSLGGWPNAWTPLVGVAGLVGSVHVVRLLAVVHIRVARVLLSPDVADRVAGLEQEVLHARERAQLARDLHDDIGHAMTLVVVQAEAARAALDGDPGYVRQALLDIGAAGRQALDELDSAVGALRGHSAARPREPGLADLSVLLRRARDAGLPVQVQLVGAVTEVSGPVSETAYRVVQEACTNVLRHAGLVPTTVTIEVSDDTVLVQVANLPGRGGAARRTGSGLAGLAERVRLLGGTCEAGPGPDGRWLVTATLPRGLG